MRYSVLNGRQPVTTTSALIFEAALDILADSLLKMQMKYNIHTAKKDNALVDKLKQIRRVAAVLYKNKTRKTTIILEWSTGLAYISASSFILPSLFGNPHLTISTLQ